MSSFLQSVLPGVAEPDVSYNFVVLIGIRPFGDFRSVTGAGITLTPQSLVEGGRNHSPHLLPHAPGSVSQWGEVTLRWGTPIWTTLYDWADAVRVGKFYRRDVFVIQLKRNGWPTRLMRFAGAWPRSWKASPLDTASSEWSLEELTLVYEDFNMIVTRTSSLGDLVNSVSSMADGLVSLGGDVGDVMLDPTASLRNLGERLYDEAEDVVHAWDAPPAAREDEAPEELVLDAPAERDDTEEEEQTAPVEPVASDDREGA